MKPVYKNLDSFKQTWRGDPWYTKPVAERQRTRGGEQIVVTDDPNFRHLFTMTADQNSDLYWSAVGFHPDEFSSVVKCQRGCGIERTFQTEREAREFTDRMYKNECRGIVHNTLASALEARL